MPPESRFNSDCFASKKRRQNSSVEGRWGLCLLGNALFECGGFRKRIRRVHFRMNRRPWPRSESGRQSAIGNYSFRATGMTVYRVNGGARKSPHTEVLRQDPRAPDGRRNRAHTALKGLERPLGKERLSTLAGPSLPNFNVLAKGCPPYGRRPKHRNPRHLETFKRRQGGLPA